MPAGAKEELVEFDHRLKELARYAPVTAALLAMNVVIWVMMVVKGADWLDPSADTLRAWGANYGPFSSRGDGWRLATCLFLHAGIVQLAVNQWALYQLGNWLERFFGSIGFLLLYFLAGFAGSVLGVRWRPDAVLAGSTSAIAGLIGAVAAFYWRTPGIVPSIALNRLRAGTFVFLAYNIGVEIYRQRIDSGGFFGGLAAGFLIGLLLAQPIVAGERAVRWRRNGLLAAAGAVMIWFTPLILRPGPPNVPSEAVQWHDVIEQTLETFLKAEDNYKAGRITAKEFLRVVEQEILPKWRGKEAHLRSLDLSGLTPFGAEQMNDIKRSTELRRQAYELLADAIWQDDDDAYQRGLAKMEAAVAIENRVLEAFGRQEAQIKRDRE